MPDGSRTTEHFKCIWVGPEGVNSQYWREGGCLIWDEFEAIMDQGQTPTGRYNLAQSIPAGYGGN